MRATRVGDAVAEGEGRAVLERLVPLADDAEHGTGVAADVRDVARHRDAERLALASDHGFERVLLHAPVQAGGGDHRGRIVRLV